MTAKSTQRDVAFRSEEIGYILTKIKAGDCCSVVGVGSVGKTNLLRHLLDRRTQEHHWPGSSRELTMVLIDPNNMLDSLPLKDSERLSPWAGYEIMVHRLYKAFYPFTGFSQDDFKQIKSAYDLLHDGTNPYVSHLGLRYLEFVLEILLAQPDSQGGKGRRIAIIFDEFEEMLANLPAKFFQTLRGIRDDHKYRLTYVTFTRRSLPQIIQENEYDHLALEPFSELFTDCTLYLGPYSESDARAMLDQLSERKEVTYPPSFRAFLLRASDGHAGLLRASFELAAQIAFGTPESDAMRFLSNSPSIQAECETMWESLTREEQKALKQIAQQPTAGPDDSATLLLSKKKLLKTKEDNKKEVNPPLFREYVRRRPENE